VITVLVTGAGGGVGQGIIKCLKLIKDLDIRIIAADMSPNAAGLYAGNMAYLVAPCKSENYLSSLAEIFAAEKVDFYIPGTDVELEFCAANKAIIKEKYNVQTVVSRLEAVQISDNKYKTYEFLKTNGFPCPETTWAKDVDPAKVQLPVIVKPAVGCRSIGVFKIASEKDLHAQLANPEGLILQELIGTEHSEYTCTVVRVDDNISPVIILNRELRSGDTFRAEPVKSDAISAYVRSVALKLDIEGSCNFQLRVDQDNIPKIFEINCRFSGTTPFCAQLGFNPVEYYLKAKLGLPYTGEIDFNSMVLRHWTEVMVTKDQIACLKKEKRIEPKVVSQSRLV
jgi:carbamoyl-phosphate synthase large subunit